MGSDSERPSEVGGWLRENAASLNDIARSLRTSIDLVHMVAVLVLAGLSDGQVADQLLVLQFERAATPASVERAVRAIIPVRALVAAHPFRAAHRRVTQPTARSAIAPRPSAGGAL